MSNLRVAGDNHYKIKQASGHTKKFRVLRKFCYVGQCYIEADTKDLADEIAENLIETQEFFELDSSNNSYIYRKE